MKVVVWIWLIAVAILGVFDFNLLMFHTWLKWKNLSTFEYISNSRIAKSVEIMINSDNKCAMNGLLSLISLVIPFHKFSHLRAE